MSTQVTIPRFISNSQVKKSSTTGTFNDDGDQLDFDLLAEYLMDDVAGGSHLDFGNDFEYQLGTVSPDFSDDIFLGDPLDDSIVPPTSITSNQQIDTSNNGSHPYMGMLNPSSPQTNSQSVNMLPQQQQQPFTTTSLSNKPPTTKTVDKQPSKRQRVLPPPPTLSAPQNMIKLPNHTPITATSHIHATTYPNTLNSQTLPKRGRKDKSQAQIDRRRERNRILARRTRLRKKFFFESLQKEVMDLQQENLALKEIVRTELESEVSTQILESSNASKQLHPIVLEHCGDPSALGQHDFNLVQSIQHSQQSFIITDPGLEDNPIIFVSAGFSDLTGYRADEIIARNCRFMQGPLTCPKKISQMKEAIAYGEDISLTLVNYKADGTPFWNKVFIASLRDAENNVVNFIGVCVEVAGPEVGDPEEGLCLNEVSTNSNTKGLNATKNLMDVSKADIADVNAAVIAIESAVTAAVEAGSTIVKRS